MCSPCAGPRGLLGGHGGCRAGWRWRRQGADQRGARHRRAWRDRGLRRRRRGVRACDRPWRGAVPLQGCVRVLAGHHERGRGGIAHDNHGAPRRSRRRLWRARAAGRRRAGFTLRFKMRTIVLPSQMELLELGRGGVVKVVCFRQHITLVLAPSSPGDAPAAAGVELAPAAAAAAPMKEVAAAAGSGAGRRRRGQRHRRRRREARAALLLQRLARGWVARLRVRGLRGSREEQVFGSLGSEPEQPAHAVERPTVLVLATSTAWEARRQEVAASAVEVEAPAAGLLPKDRPKLSPEKRKVGSAEPASPSKRALVAVVPTWQIGQEAHRTREIQVAARRWLARRYVARLRAAVPQLPPPLESGDGAPSAAEAKRRVSFSALVPPSKRALVETGIGAGWLREMARAPKVDGATNGG